MGKYINHTKVVDFRGSTFWVNSEPSGIYTTILSAMLDQLDAMLSYHSKVHLIRIDLHQPTFTDDNKRITTFIRRYSKQLCREYGFKRIGYCWVRELETAKSQHYHFVFILDGHRVQGGGKLARLARETWEQMGGTEWTPAHHYYNIKRYDHQSLQDAIWRISYLAKGRGKGYRPTQTKDYGTSRIR